MTMDTLMMVIKTRLKRLIISQKVDINEDNLRIFVHLAMTNGLSLKCTEVNRIRWENFEILKYSCSLIEHAKKTEEESLRENTCSRNNSEAVFEYSHKWFIHVCCVKYETFVVIFKHCVFR